MNHAQNLSMRTTRWVIILMNYEKSMPESLSFLRTQPVPPMIDHLSFKLGNQIFVYMDPMDGGAGL